MIASDIKWVHIELSSKCNAWCPVCPRNNNGYGLREGLVEQDLPTDKVAEILVQLPNLHSVQLCGNYGDPVVASNFLEVVDLVKSLGLKLQVHTNGSMRNGAWWAALGATLKGTNHDIWFGIDGIGSVHEIHRQGTDYYKIIKNARAFIDAGGSATWQFIPFAHNEHQVKDCLRLSQKLKFKNFKLVKLFRQQAVAKHYRTGESFDLLPPNEFRTLIRMPDQRTLVKEENCMHLTQPSIYVSATGKISTCCYFSSTKTFDTVQELLHNTVDLTQQLCIKSCG